MSLHSSQSGSLSHPTGRPSPAAPPPADPAALPQTIGKYQVLERLGAGAMGVVYKCRQPDLDRLVAVKVLLAARHASPGQRQRFQREARAAARLAHPNVVPIYDVADDGELTWFVMEYVDGCSLDRLIGSPALTVDHALRLVCQLARALQAAHDQGIIHRDIKPSNILIHRSGQPKLADFGLAKSLHDGGPLSGSGDLIGTPQYMSPEQVLDPPEEIDARTDVYSLGVVLYEMLTGRRAVDGPNVLAILRRLTDEEPVSVRAVNPAVPQEVADLCARAMARDRAERFATAGAFAEAIQRYLLEKLLGKPEPLDALGLPELLAALPPATLPTPRRRPWPWRRLVLAAALLAGMVAAGGWALSLGLHQPPSRGGENLGAEHDHLAATRDGLVAHAREQLRGALRLPETTTPRDHLKALLEDLTALLKRSPDDLEVRLLRARAYRRGGEHLAACDDLTHLLGRDPNHLAAVMERVLANYELFILYFGNLNEPAVRPRMVEHLDADLALLRERGDASQKYAVALVQALAQHDYVAAGKLVRTEPFAELPPESQPDWAMLEADALSQAAEHAYQEEQNAGDDEAKAEKRRGREELVRRALQALRRGLEADPNHVGLLFLKANSFQRRATWEATDNEDRDTAFRRYKPAFETACDRLRRITLRAGCDTPVARAVLLSNINRHEPALDQMQDALSSRPNLPYLYTFRAWLQLQVPPDGILSAEEVQRILHELQPAFDTPPDDASPYFVRALLEAAVGNWDEARRDLRLCRRNLGRDDLATTVPAYADWLAKAHASTSEYLYSTRDLLGYLSVPVEVRIRLGEELLRRLGDAGNVEQDGLKAEQVRDMKGWTHFGLAQAFAEKEERGKVLQHVREALQLKMPDLTAKTCQEDGTLKAWNDDAEFVQLYKEFP
jgi:tetratricopeptide (TPR) repeat protein/predicted Ser/Thr protein kinase